MEQLVQGVVHGWCSILLIGDIRLLIGGGQAVVVTQDTLALHPASITAIDPARLGYSGAHMPNSPSACDADVRALLSAVEWLPRVNFYNI